MIADLNYLAWADNITFLSLLFKKLFALFALC